MNIIVKFCGGCNPRYDRRTVYDKILTMLSKCDKIVTVDQNEICDILLIIKGCTGCNDEFLNINAKYRYFIHNENEANEVLNILKSGGN